MVVQILRTNAKQPKKPIMPVTKEIDLQVGHGLGGQTCCDAENEAHDAAVAEKQDKACRVLDVHVPVSNQSSINILTIMSSAFTRT